MSNKYVVVDLETTGNSVKKGDRIIQFAAVVIKDNQIVDQFSTLLNPDQPIPIFIEELTGINDDMVKDAPSFIDIAPKVLELLKDAYFVAHNVLFDLSFLQEELIMAGFEGFYGPILDTVEMARILFPTNDGYKLSDLAAQFELNHERPHQANSDAYVTGELLVILFDRLHNLPIITLKQLHKFADGLKGELNEILEELILEKERNVENLPTHFEVYNGICIKKDNEKVFETERPVTEYPATDEEKANLLKKGFAKFERRKGQFQMMDTVFHSFQKEQHALIEAGTGVGKSLAYLLPAVYTSIEKKEPIVISTYTTQLQEQLLQKDIPLLNKIISQPFSTVLMKGKSHYISLEKFVGSLRDTDDNYDTILTKMQILVWLTETTTGDRDELNLSSGGRLFWHKIKYDDHFHQGKSSSSNKDYYWKARKKAQTADIIITNHSLLLSDLVAERPVLPDFNYCVIDEGHHFEEAAGKYFGHKLDYAFVRFLLQKMGIDEQKFLASKMEKLLTEVGGNQNELLHPFELKKMMTELQYEMDEFFKLIAITGKKRAKNKFQPQLSCPLPLVDQTKEANAIVAKAERFLFCLQDYLKAVKDRYDFLLANINDKNKKHHWFVEEIYLWLKDMEKIKQNLKEMIVHGNAENATWIELDLRAWQNNTTIYSQPLFVASHLQELFFSSKKSIIITSATLSVRGSFQFSMERLGLEKNTCSSMKIISPFRYDQQLKFIIANDLPEINSVSTEEYVSSISEHIISIAEATKGRLLILFTSNEMLRKTYELIKESGFLQDYSILAQGITAGSRERLIRNFQRFEKAILLGTNSFWEGIDIPGEDLSCLVMVRLPFSPPDEPLTDAKCKEIKKRGGNSFYDYSLPEAVIRFKQGFGRLIRTTFDKGIFIIFDRRIISTKYGKVFQDSLPDVTAKELNIEQTVKIIKEWL